MQTIINMAGLNVQVNCVYGDRLKLFHDYVSADTAFDFSVTVTEEDIAEERIKSVKEAELEKIPYGNFTPCELEFTAVFRKIAQKISQYDGLVFHGSAVAVGNKAFLFTAPSGTGKSTHSLLWLKNVKDSYIVNGDKPIIRFFEDGVKVCGNLWNGKENYGINKCVPLKAICVINRGKTNSIKEISFSEAFPVLIGQTYRSSDRDVLLKTMTLLNNIGNSVKLYSLTCNMEDDAALVAYRGMCDE